MSLSVVKVYYFLDLILLQGGVLLEREKVHLDPDPRLGLVVDPMSRRWFPVSSPLWDRR